MLGVGMGLGQNSFGCVLYLPGWYPRPYSWLESLICRHYGSGCDDGSVRNYRIVHDNRTHAHYHIVSDDASVNVRTVPDGNIVTDYALRLLICGMKYGIVLNVHTVADVYRPDIATQYGSIPYAAVVTYFHSAYYRGRLSQKCALADYWLVALEFLDYRHIFPIVLQR